MTPRKALVAQMVDDLTTRFWRKLGAAYTGDGLQEGLTGEALEDLAARLKGKARPVRTLAAHDYKQIWAERSAPRQVWVGTFNALHRLLRVEPPAHRNFYAREAQEAAAALDDLEGADPGQSIEAFQDLIRSVDLVIVDEGHHEPAFSWAQAVRTLKKPTVVFSATPYRNDY
jgi:superfamily II DNA or RNA helicase